MMLAVERMIMRKRVDKKKKKINKNNQKKKKDSVCFLSALKTYAHFSICIS